MTAPLIEDRVTRREWQIDTAVAGAVYMRTERPAKRRRQKIVRYLGRDGTVEQFEIIQTIPYPGHEEWSPPTQAQYTAVMDFFLEPVETKYQANTLLSARDFAESIAKGYSFSAYRRRLIWLATTAFILGDRTHRSRVRAWGIKNWNSRYSATVDVVGRKAISGFADKLVDDMRGAGSTIFG